MAPTRREHVSCGLELCAVADLPEAITDATEAGYQFVFAPIVHPRYRREMMRSQLVRRKEPFTRSDMVLSSQDWSTLFVGQVSEHLDLDIGSGGVDGGEWSCERRRHSELQFHSELTFATHLSLPAISLKLRHGNNVNLARQLSSRLNAACPYQIWVDVPLTPPSRCQSLHVSQCDDRPHTNGLVHDDHCHDDDDDVNVTWRWWHDLQHVCGEELRLGLCLRITADLPAAGVDACVRRWLGEPLKCVSVPVHVFTTNRAGFPVLPRSHQMLLRQLMATGCQFVLSGTCASKHGHVKHYAQYLNHLYKAYLSDRAADPLADMTDGYEDWLQVPLQPLMDNLESHTYEVFEKCPVKYTAYQNAMYEAFIDCVPEERKSDQTIVVMVVGAGRGPLVRAAFLAAQKASRIIRVYAVEKNPNAVVTLLSSAVEEWGDSVVVVDADMRHWQPPELADVIVSELLGSFGDNELSPECLDGAQRYLKPGGVSIPMQYTSFIQPVQSPRLLQEVRQARDKDKPAVTPFEMPYVVYLHNVSRLAPTQPLFCFQHPNKEEVVDNSRHAVRSFSVDMDCSVHGIAGYFECRLYGDIMISTNPGSQSSGMCSWFPIYFPLRESVSLRRGDVVDVAFWRLASERHVWYEWTVTEPRCLPVHNPNGRSYTIGL